MTSRFYQYSRDYQWLAEWWKAHGHPDDFPAAMLPPLSIIVSDVSGDLFFLCCYECYGVGVGLIEYPVSRPGLTLPQAREAFNFAFQTVREWAGQRCEPKGDYRVFRAAPSIAVFRAMRGSEWLEEYPGERHIQCIWLANAATAGNDGANEID